MNSNVTKKKIIMFRVSKTYFHFLSDKLVSQSWIEVLLILMQFTLLCKQTATVWLITHPFHLKSDIGWGSNYFKLIVNGLYCNSGAPLL